MYVCMYVCMCIYIHDDLVISVDEAERFRARYRQDLGSIRVQICKWHKSGVCRSGDNCPFIHAKREAELDGIIFNRWA